MLSFFSMTARSAACKQDCVPFLECHVEVCSSVLHFIMNCNDLQMTRSEHAAFKYLFVLYYLHSFVSTQMVDIPAFSAGDESTILHRLRLQV